MRVTHTRFAGGRGLIRVDETAATRREGIPTDDASGIAFDIDGTRVAGNASGTDLETLGRASADALAESGTGSTHGHSRLPARTGMVRS